MPRLLLVATAFLMLAGICFFGVVRLRPRHTFGLLMASEAALTFLVTSTLCASYALLFWADRKWKVLARFTWPKPKA